MSIAQQTAPVVCAGIYTRISSDPSGQRAGVERQRADCEAHCAGRGWVAAEIFCDNDASAYAKRPRPAYGRMLAAVAAGRLGAIVTWHNDRLHRSPRELESFIDLVERTGIRLAVVTGGDYDLTTPDGRLAARIVGAVARKESEDRSRRVRRKHLELAEQGRPAGELGWGVRSDAERELVREAATRVLAGQGLITIVRDWNRRGVPGPTERPWGAPTLRRALLSARMAGLREHGVDASGKTLGSLTAAVWRGALDRATWEQLRVVLLNPERTTNLRAPSRRLLTGLTRCGVCGGAMQSRPRDDRTKRYVCAGRRPGHQLAIVAEAAEELVTGRVLALLAHDAVRSAMLGCGEEPCDTDSLGAALAALAQAQARARSLDDDYYVLGRLPEARYRSVQSRLEREIERLRHMVDRATRQQAILHPDPVAYWSGADLAQRRALLHLVVERVTIVAGRPGVPRFDPGRVRVEVVGSLQAAVKSIDSKHR